ncbi:MAG: hypothetical protein H7Y43_16455 [Akkermansiaceae bacterium]|nr:hypothetical protein [Verrucomicrobiales bacterium]
MAHFTLTVDSNPDRRLQFIAQAGKQLSCLDGLDLKQAENHELAIIWAKAPLAPSSFHVDEKAFGLLLGYSVDDAGQWLDSRALQSIWTGETPRDKRLGGYFAALTYSPAHGLILGGDLLGFFPLYYAEADGALLASSSPELIAAHPAFKAELDFRGLTGIFLTNGLVNGHALVRGIKRLKHGHHLVWNRRQGAVEKEIFQFVATDSLPSCSPEEARELADTELLRAIRWHRPPHSASTLMLSGGLDSRLMAGYLSAEGITRDAVCLGRRTDFEVQVGGRVAAALAMNVHRETHELEPDGFARDAHQLARFEHLSGGFGFLEANASARVVAQSAPMFWSGFALEDVLGGDAMGFGLDPKTRVWSFEHLLSRLNEWAVPVRLLPSLLRTGDAREVIREQIAALEQQYAQGPETEARRCMRLKLFTRARFHVGQTVHRLAFGSWPLLPILDRRLLEKQFSIPTAVMMNRQLQRNMLTHRFPELARIPREHNSFRFEPLRQTRFADLATALETRIRKRYWRWRGEEPRRYFRCFDLNSPLWKAVRADAEKNLARLDPWLDRKALAALPWPAPEKLRNNPFTAGATQRLIFGLALWAARK